MKHLLDNKRNIVWDLVNDLSIGLLMEGGSLYMDKVYRLLIERDMSFVEYKKVLDEFVGNDYIDIRLQHLTDVRMIKTIAEYYRVVCSSGET